MPEYVSLIGNGGVTAILGWLVWYHTRRQMPRMETIFREEIDQRRTEFYEIAKSINRLSRMVLIMVAKQNGEDLESLMKIFEDAEEGAKCVICPYRKVAEKAVKQAQEIAT